MIISLISQLEVLKNTQDINDSYDFQSSNPDQINVEFRHKYGKALDHCRKLDYPPVKYKGKIYDKFQDLPDNRFHLNGAPIKQLSSEALDVLTQTQFDHLNSLFDDIVNLEAVGLSDHQSRRMRDIISGQTLGQALDFAKIPWLARD